MDLIGQLLEPRATYAPWDDFWFKPAGWNNTASGMAVTPDGMMQISAVYAAVGILSETLAQVPLKLYRRDGRNKVVAADKPLYSVLHDRANGVQTSMEWREMSMAHVALRGNAFSEISAGRRGPVAELWPLNPDRMRVIALPSRRLGYSYRRDDGATKEYTQDEIFHVRGRSLDGISGLNPVAFMRESMGLTQALETFGALLFKQGALHRGVFKHPGKLSDPAYKRLQADLEKQGGLDNAHRTRILEEGMSWEKISMSSEDAQFLLSRKFQLSEIARWFHVPPHLLGDLDKATFSNIEQQSLEFVLFTMMPWFVRWEQRINADLIGDRENYFAEFSVDGLLRGDAASRWAAHKAAIEIGVLTRNEVREMENRNPIDGLDKPLVAQNMATVDESGNVIPANNPAPPAPGAPDPAVDDNVNAALIDLYDRFDARRSAPAPLPDKEAAEKLEYLQRVVGASAERIMRKEGRALMTALKRHGGDAVELEKWAQGFYQDQAKFVADTLCIDDAKAEKFATHQRDRLFLSLKDGCAAELIKELESEGGEYVLKFLRNGHGATA